MDTLTDLLVALMGSDASAISQAAATHQSYLEDTDEAAAHQFRQSWTRARAQCPTTPTLLGTCKRGNRQAQVYRTNGVDALVLGAHMAGTHMTLRVAHDPEGNGRRFTDYSWMHDDASVRLVDPLAVLYVYDDGTCTFDHSPEVLGLEISPA